MKTPQPLNYPIHQIQQALKQGNHILGVFIDLSKAFYTINHSILHEKLENYEVRGNTLKFIESYLPNENQYVNFLGEFGKPRQEECFVFFILRYAQSTEL